MKKQKKPNGYVALASVLVIAVIVVIIGNSTSILSINEIQSSLSSKKNEESLDFVEGCVEDALLRLNEDEAIPSSLSLPEGTCSVTINSQSGDDWTFTVTTTLNGHTKSVQVSATRDTTVTITSWKEI